jgi:acyl-CoA thioester hydrolase
MFFNWLHVVTKEETDWLGHANNVAFVEWIQSAAIAHSSSVGWTTERYIEHGSAFMVHAHRITYLAQAQAGDELRVRTWVEDMTAARSLRRYEVERLGKTVQCLARAETIWAFVDLQKGVPRRIPEAMLESFPVRSRRPMEFEIDPNWALAEW